MARILHFWAAAWTVPCCLALLTASAFGAGSRVVHVEEHWELRLGQPNAEQSAPQTTMVMSPHDGLYDIHFLFTLNHWTVPDYAPGGMQLQAWSGESFLDDKTANEVGSLADGEEVIRWVQRLTLDEGQLRFQIANGDSETWGSFGGDDLSLNVDTTLDSLNQYRPGLSLTESQVSYAENRVQSLTLTKLVWITDDGEVHEMNAPIAVDTSLDP